MSDFDDIPSFVMAAEHAVSSAAINVRLRETRRDRVMRRWSMSEVAEILDCPRSYLYSLLKHPDAPEGVLRGREKTLGVDDIMRLRALASARPGSQKDMLNWRKPGDPLKIITISSQKGGTGKSLVASHLSQGLCLLGQRVLVIDCDPQATCSLYFVSSDVEVAGPDVETFAEFMGVPEPGADRPIIHSPARLNSFLRATPWPGLRLLPGGAAIQEADIAMYFLSQSRQPDARRVYRMLHDALDRWSAAHPPRTQPQDFLDGNGRFREEAYQAALTETVDVVIMDTAPSLTLAQLNAVVAASTLVIPQTFRGFDLATLQIYLSSLNDYLGFIARDRDPVAFPKARPFILPTIVARNDTDIRTIGEIYAANPGIISPIFYRYSDGASNALRDFKSAFEYEPEKARRASMRAFADNANAVNDAIISRALPHLPSRGLADAFIRETYPEGAIPRWADAPPDPVYPLEEDVA